MEPALQCGVRHRGVRRALDRNPVGCTVKRTEPTQALIPRGDQKRLAYVSANDTDIRKRFDAMRKPQRPVLLIKEKQA